MSAGFDSSDDLYREIILEHYRHPRHRGTVDPADATAEGTNPLCGDDITLTWKLSADGSFHEVGFTGSGCSISMASASMLCDALTGTGTADAIAIAEKFRAMLLAGGPAEGLGDLEALQGVASYPVRIKCAVLPWNALLQGMGEPVAPDDV